MRRKSQFWISRFQSPVLWGCKPAGTVNLNRKFCQHKGCPVHPRFAFSGGLKVGMYCKAHSKPGMIYIANHRCLECDKDASYCYPNNTRRLYCHLHFKPGMINRNQKLRKERKAAKTPSRHSSKDSSKEIYFTGVQFNQDGTVKSWGTKIK